MKYAQALADGLTATGIPDHQMLIARIKAELAMISVEVSLLLPNWIRICWHERTLVINNAMGRTFGIARMETTLGKGWPMTIVWAKNQSFAVSAVNTEGEFSEALQEILSEKSTARIIAYVAAIPGAILTEREIALAEKSVQHPELFKP